MKADFAERFAQMRTGKSGRPTAPENRSPDFQAGYARGLTRVPMCSLDRIGSEYARRGEPHPDSLDWPAFVEWKRGYWAGVFASLTAPQS